MKLKEYLYLEDYEGTEDWEVIDVFYSNIGYSDEEIRTVVAKDPASRKEVRWEQKRIIRDEDSSIENYTEYTRCSFSMGW